MLHGSHFALVFMLCVFACSNRAAGPEASSAKNKTETEAKTEAKTEAITKSVAPSVEKTEPGGSEEAPPSACPLAIKPGVSLGPIRLDMSRAELEKTKLPLESVMKDEQTEIIGAGPLFKVELCGGKVHQVWIDDLRKVPDCVSLSGKPIRRDIPRKRFLAKVRGCKELPVTGSVSMACEEGGLVVGYGMGGLGGLVEGDGMDDFLQIRIAHDGADLYDDCRHALDDGHPVMLSDEDFVSLLEQTLDLEALSNYWHVREPGRRPLHVLLPGGELRTPSIQKFGEPVVFDNKEPGFVITEISASETRVRFDFKYAVEGISGHTLFKKSGDMWILDDSEVSEN